MGEIIGEVLINNEWKPFTEQISHDMKPLSVWDDLIFLGTSNNVRYTSARKLIKEKLQSLKNK